MKARDSLLEQSKLAIELDPSSAPLSFSSAPTVAVFAVPVGMSICGSVLWLVTTPGPTPVPVESLLTPGPTPDPVFVKPVST